MRILIVAAMTGVTAVGCIPRPTVVTPATEQSTTATPSQTPASGPSSRTVDNPNVELTQAARDTLRGFADEHSPGRKWWLRIAVVPGGCTGMMDKLDFDRDGPAADDVEFISGGVWCVAAEDQLVLIQGTQIDYVAAKDGFAVTRPNMTAENRRKMSRWIETEARKRGIDISLTDDASETPTDAESDRP